MKALALWHRQALRDLAKTGGHRRWAHGCVDAYWRILQHLQDAGLIEIDGDSPDRPLEARITEAGRQWLADDAAGRT